MPAAVEVVSNHRLTEIAVFPMIRLSGRLTAPLVPSSWAPFGWVKLTPPCTIPVYPEADMSGVYVVVPEVRGHQPAGPFPESSCTVCEVMLPKPS